MKPAQYKTYMPQGATWRRTFTWKISDTPISLTGEKLAAGEKRGG